MDAATLVQADMVPVGDPRKEGEIRWQDDRRGLGPGQAVDYVKVQGEMENIYMDGQR